MNDAVPSTPAHLSLEDVLITDELARRPAHPPDHAAENRALLHLADVLAAEPARLLQALVGSVLDVCHAESAGVSILVPEGEGIFRWDAVAGVFAHNAGGSLPRSHSPCGTVIDRDAVLLFDRPGRYFDALTGIEPPIVDALLAPFHVDGRPAGTVWALNHTPERRFDAEDARVLTSLSRFAAAGYQMNASLRAVAGAHAELEGRVAQRTADLSATATALRESEERGRATVEQAAVGIVEAGLDRRLLRVNPGFCALLGYTAEEALELSVDAVTHPDDRDADHDAAGRLLRGEVPAYTMEKRYLRKDGTAVWVNITVSLVRDEDGAPLRAVAIVQDIDAGKRAELALAEQEQHLRLALAAGHFGAWTWDVRTDAVRWSPRTGEIYGLPPERSAGTIDEINARLHPDERATINAEIAAILSERDEYDVEHRIVHPDGRERHLEAWGRVHRDAAGEMVHIDGLVADVTERVQIETALRERDAQLALALQAAGAGISTLDLATGVGTTTPEWRDAIGLPPPPAPQTFETFLALVHPDDRERVVALHAGAGVQGEGLHYEFRVNHPTRGERWLLSRSVHADLPDGGPGCLIGIAMDITERKRAEERQAFLLKLSDALRPLTDPVAVQETASRTLGEHLGTDRVHYVEIDDTSAGYVVAHGWHKPGAPSRARRYALDGWQMPWLMNGETWVVSDTDSDPALPDDQRTAHCGNNIGAAIVVPLIKGDRLVATFVTNQRAARVWTAHEVALVEAVAERTWTAIERARAEAALRASEARYRAIFEQARVGIVQITPDGQMELPNSGFCAIVGRPHDEVRRLTVREVTHPEDYDAETELTRRLLAGAIPGFTLEKRYMHGDGHLIWGEMTVSLVRAVTGEPDYMLAIVEDITERKRAEEALRASEARLRATFDQAAVGIVTATPDGKILTANERFCSLIGCAPEGVPGLTVADITHPDDVELDMEHARRVTAGEIPSYAIEKRYIRRDDGGTVWVNLTSSLVRTRDGEPDYAMAIVEDINDRKAAEDALRASEARYRTLVQNLPDYAIFRLDPAGLITEWTEGAERVKGYTTEEVLGRHLAMFYTPEEVAAGEPGRELAEAARTGRAEREQWRVRKGGERFWVNEIATAIYDPDGRLAAFTKISRDLTERRAADTALRESEERHRLIVEGARDYAILTLDIAGGIASWSPGAEAAFGWTVAEVLGQSVDVTFTPEDRAEGVPEQERAAARAFDVTDDARWHQCKDGGRVFIEGTTRALRDPDGHLTGFLKIGQDVTERRRLEEERERLAVAEAVAAERQALLRRIVEAQEDERRRMAHEVHDGVTQLAAAAALHTDEALSLLPGDGTEAHHELERARDLSRRAVNEARRLITALRPEALDDFGLAGAVLQEVEALGMDGWRATFEDGDRGVARLAPETEITLYRVAQEALTNVRKHSTPGRVRVRLRRMNGTVVLEVRDWGRGFDPAAVSAGAAGERVGLMGMRERLSALGGSLSVRSSPGNGVTIRATLPLPEDR